MNYIETYYDKTLERLYITDGVLVYFIPNLSFDFICNLFWESDTNWVNYFGKVPRGICWQHKMFDVEPCPQANCIALYEWVKQNRDKWEMDLKKSLHFSIWNLRLYVFNVSYGKLKLKVK